MKTANLTLRGAALATAVLLGATACGSGDSASSTANPKVTVILGTASDSFYNTLGCGAKAEGKKLGATVDVQGATTFDPATQTPILTSTVAKKPNAIVIAPTDSKALGTPLKQANEAGIKIVTADTGLDDTSFISSAVSSNNEEGGAEAARTLAKLVGEKGKVVIIGGTPGVTTADQRIKGFETEIKKYPDITFVGVQPSTPSGGVVEAARLTAASLSKDPDLAGIFSISTPASDGANNAIKDAGKVGKVKVVGFDAGPAQVEQLKKGTVQALIAQKAEEIGAEAVRQAVNAVQGKKVTKTIGTSFVSITADNLGDANVSKYVYRSTC
ncbi:ABC transporter substrate-binding protein [Streptomyces geranii]|uniref:ABC transporter substrate-binding protein n=1 Tax=Streptomyces geranii TaxID=2058923 RepID=UPI000D031336|nr:ABC transporter substrate-binding protein [Streptomyces geranii]